MNSGGNYVKGRYSHIYKNTTGINRKSSLRMGLQITAMSLRKNGVRGSIAPMRGCILLSKRNSEREHALNSGRGEGILRSSNLLPSKIALRMKG